MEKLILTINKNCIFILSLIKPYDKKPVKIMIPRQITRNSGLNLRPAENTYIQSGTLK